MRRLAIVLLGCAACGRLDFDARSADATATATDDTTVASDCWAAWRSGAPRFGPPTPITELAESGKQGNPWLAPDDRTLYFDSGTTNTEMFRATRPARDQPFGAPQQLTELSSPNEDTGLMLAGDLAVFSSTRPGSRGFDIYLVDRPDPASPFSTPDQSQLANVTSSANEVDPFLTSDALTLVYAESNVSDQILMISTRQAIDMAFGPPVRVMGTGTFTLEADPDLSPDQLVLAFAAINGASLQLFAAVRATPDAAFLPPFRLSDLASAGLDGDPAFSADGCELLWISDRGGDRDLFHATVLP